MSFNFSNEAQQTTTARGPVPAGSIVLLKSELKAPFNPAHDNPLIALASTGLRMLNFRFEVTEGQYKGVSFFQNISLPVGYQTESLTQGQETSCNLGGAMLKAILQAAAKPLDIPSLTSFNNLVFPAELGINNRHSESKNGQIFWNNQIFKVIIPEDENYIKIKSQREIINHNGAVEGTSQNQNQKQSGDNFPTGIDPNEEVPF